MQKIENKGSVFIKILAIIIILGIITAASFSIYYYSLIKSYNISATVANIQKLEKAAKIYATMNNGSFSGLNAQVLQLHGLISSLWKINQSYNNWTYPVNNSYIIGYFIGQNVWGISGSYDIGFISAIATNRQALQMCNKFKNAIVSVGYGGKAYKIDSKSTCANIISNNNTKLSISSQSQLFFGFKWNINAYKDSLEGRNFNAVSWTVQIFVQVPV